LCSSSPIFFVIFALHLRFERHHHNGGCSSGSVIFMSSPRTLDPPSFCHISPSVTYTRNTFRLSVFPFCGSFNTIKNFGSDTVHACGMAPGCGWAPNVMQVLSALSTTAWQRLSHGLLRAAPHGRLARAAELMYRCRYTLESSKSERTRPGTG